jgi:Kef-type K+ transport system membrane component KefB
MAGLNARTIGSIAGGLVLLALMTMPVAASEGELPPLVHDIGIGALLSGVFAIVFTRIRVPAIAGYILAGIVAGPLGLKLVTDPENINTISELGFVLLLFLIGLEIDIGKILKSGRTIMMTGLVQYPLIALFGFVVAHILALIGLGAVFGNGLGPLYVGLIIGGSSTLLVVKLFQETFELDTVPGRIALGLLVIEDVWAIVILVLQPNLQHPEVLQILESFVGIAVLGGITFLAARTLFPVAFRWIAKMPEIILVGAIAWCFGVVFVGANFDSVLHRLFGIETHFAVESGMGALIAGATIASLPYSIEIITKVGVVRDFFITLFFVGLGLGIPAPSGPAVLIAAVAIALAAIAARQLIVFPLLYVNGLDQRNAEVTALRIAQISEFSLVIAFLGHELGHLSADLSSAVIFAFVITALTTTPIYKSAYQLHAALAPTLRRLGFKDPPEVEREGETEWRLALLGFHRVASSLLHDIAKNDPGLVKETLVIDFNVALHDRIRAVGAHVEYGDLSNADTLHHAGIDRARVVVSTVPDDLIRGTDNRRIVATVRRLNPHAIIIANAVTLADCDAIYDAGADYVFLSRIDTAHALGDAIGMALNGTLADFRKASEARLGKPSERAEVLG